MRWIYSCPHCDSILNPDETIVLIAAHGARRVLIGFDPAPGSYRAYVPPGVEVEPGQVWDFSCPLCHASLVSYVDRGMCAIDLDTHKGKHRVYFARTAGHHATFVVSADGSVEAHGTDADTHSLEILEHV